MFQVMNPTARMPTILRRTFTALVGLCTFSTMNSNTQLAHYLCAFYLDTPTAFGAPFL